MTGEKLVIITASDDDASKTYVNKKIEKGIELGYDVEHVRCLEGYSAYRTPNGMSIGSTTADAISFHDVVRFIKETINVCNESRDVRGILLQLPLHDTVSPLTQELIDIIDPCKDVDCLTTYNQGEIMLGSNDYLPCTTQAVYDIITKNCDDINGQTVHVVGRSNLVTKPLIVALINAGASVKTWNSHFDKWEIGNSIRNDLDKGNVHFISGIGQANYFDEFWVACTTRTFDEDFKDRFFVYDIGMNRDADGKLCGDVQRDLDVAFQTPVPGGIGPKTVDNVFANLDRLRSMEHYNTTT